MIQRAMKTRGEKSFEREEDNAGYMKEQMTIPRYSLDASFALKISISAKRRVKWSTQPYNLRLKQLRTQCGVKPSRQFMRG